MGLLKLEALQYKANQMLKFGMLNDEPLIDDDAWNHLFSINEK
jgi:hypothetical protein